MPRRPPEPVIAPDVVDFRDYRAYIQAIFDLRRRCHKRPGLVALARAAGLSSGHLSNILAGRRDLDPKLSGDLGLALGLDGERHRFFVLLVALDGTTSVGARSALLRELDDMQARLSPGRRRGRPSRAELEQRARRLEAMERRCYTRTWLTNALFALLSCPSAPSEARALSRLFRGRATPTAISASLADLRALGLVVDVDGRALTTTDFADAVRYGPEPTGKALFADTWEIAKGASLHREPAARVAITLCWVDPLEVNGLMEAYQERFREAALLSEAESSASSVAREHPTLAPGQERSALVLQQAILIAPLLSEAPEPSPA